MHTIFLGIHILAMISSIAFMATAILIGLYGKDTAAKLATVGAIATTIGGITGGFLLFSAPLSLQCATLTAYVLVMMSLYVFGFGRGVAKNARLIRHSVVVQKS